MTKKTMKEHVEAFQDLLLALQEATNEGSEENSYNQFCTEMFKTSIAWKSWLNFSLETIRRLAASGQKHEAAKIASLIVSSFPTNREYYPGKKLVKRQDYEQWMREFRKLNYQYIFAAKALVCMLLYHGELQLPRTLFEEVNEALLFSDYVAETDTLKIGTLAQAKKWTVGDQMAKDPEFAASQKAAFESESGESLEIPNTEPIVRKRRDPLQDTGLWHGPDEVETSFESMAQVKDAPTRVGKKGDSVVAQIDPSHLDQID